MLTQPQIWKLKAAQKQAGIADAEYREILQGQFGVASSKSPELGNEHWDSLMSYFEAIYWRAVDAGRLPAPCKASEPFQQRGYWASKNNRQETSRDRYNTDQVNHAIEQVEQELAGLGCGPSYLAAIRSKVTHGQDTPAALFRYLGALQRTYTARLKKMGVECPF